MKFYELDENKGTIVRIDTNVFLGTVGDIVDMLVDFANTEATEVYYSNNGPEELNDLHIGIAQNFLSKASDLMDQARKCYWSKDTIVVVDIGSDDVSILEYASSVRS